MKPITLLPVNPEPVGLEAIPCNAIIGLMDIPTGDKYILTRKGNQISFSNGSGVWTQAPTIDQLLEHISLDTDNKIQLYYFTSLKQLAKWLAN